MMEALEAASAAPLGIARTIADFAGGGPRPIARRAIETPDRRTVAFVDTGGEGACALLIHGTLTILEDMWLGLADPLKQAGYRVIAVDRPGHGDSARSRLVDASPWRQAEILQAAMSALGLERPIVVGHSAGGAVALAYGMLFPDKAAGVVALAPICFPEPRLEQMLFGARATLVAGPLLAGELRVSLDQAILPTLWRAMFLPQQMPKRFEEGFPFGFAGRPSQMVAEAEDSVAMGPALLKSALCYASCRAPVEILGGGADIVVANALHGYRAAMMIPGARYRSLPGMGHMLHHFHQEDILRAMRSFDASYGVRRRTRQNSI